MIRIARILFLITIVSMAFTKSAFSQKEIFIQQIEFKLDAVSDIEYENEYFMTLKMNKGSKYIFKVTNHVDDYVGEAVVELLDADNLILTNLFGDKYFASVSFQCNKTGFYDVLVKFRDNKLGNSVIDVVLVQ